MARTFTGASNHTLALASAVVTDEPITMACWGRCTDTTNSQYAICVGDTTSGSGAFHAWALNFAGHVASDPVRAVVWESAAAAVAASASGYSSGVWCHAGAVFASATSRTAYINGSGGTPETTARSPTVAPARTAIGALFQGSTTPVFGFSGDLAEVGIWSVALTAGEMLVLSKGVSPLRVRPESLVCYVPIVGRYSPEIDLVGGNAFTVSGATQSVHPRFMRPRTRTLLKLPAPVAGGGSGVGRGLTRSILIERGSLV